MFRVALSETLQAQAQLIVFAAELDRAVTQHFIVRAVIGGFEFDLDALGTQWSRADAGQLLQPAGNDRVDHKAVIAVVRADRVEPQPGTLGSS
jgi:hypothetical protein